MEYIRAGLLSVLVNVIHLYYNEPDNTYYPTGYVYDKSKNN